MAYPLGHGIFRVVRTKKFCKKVCQNHLPQFTETDLRWTSCFIKVFTGFLLRVLQSILEQLFYGATVKISYEMYVFCSFLRQMLPLRSFHNYCDWLLQIATNKIHFRHFMNDNRSYRKSCFRKVLQTFELIGLSSGHTDLLCFLRLDFWKWNF